MYGMLNTAGSCASGGQRLHQWLSSIYMKIYTLLTTPEFDYRLHDSRSHFVPQERHERASTARTYDATRPSKTT